MHSGIYKKIEGNSGLGKFYQVLFVAREHHTGIEAVVYLPLRIEPQWAGTCRPCYLERKEFESKFEFVGERLPDDLSEYTP